MLRRFKKKLPVYKVKTVQINGRLIILDGHNHLRYVDLATNKVHQYKRPKRFKFTFRVRMVP